MTFKYLLILILANLNYFLNGQSIEYKIDSLLSDTIGIDYFFKKNLKEISEKYKVDLKENNQLFPFSKYDSVVFYTLNDEYFKTGNLEFLSFIIDNKTGNLGNSVNLNGIKLSDIQIHNLHKIINSPFSYNFGYSATPFPKYGLVYYLKGKIIAYFDLNKNNSQINVMYPNLYLIRQGNFTLKA